MRCCCDDEDWCGVTAGNEGEEETCMKGEGGGAQEEAQGGG